MSQDYNDTELYTINNFTIVSKTTDIYKENPITSESGNIKGVESSVTSIENALGVIGEDCQNVGMVTLDGLFCPFTTESGHDILSYWEVADSGSDSITNQHLNPFFPNQLALLPTGNSFYNSFYESGNNIAGYNSFSGAGVDSSGDLNPYADLHDNSKVENFARGVGFRTPAVFTGWGFDINGNPVPADTGDPTVFASGAFKNPNLWKSGPLDVRWDSDRNVWTGGNTTKVYLVKMTNVYNPPTFSYEVERSSSRSQFTRNAPSGMQSYVENSPIHDPEYLAYNANADNQGTYEQLDYTGIEFPYYEAFIIRETIDDVGANYYNIGTEDCQDCGHITNPCASGSFPRHESSGTLSAGKKILIENPLKQSFDTGDVAFTVKTGRSKSVNTGSFTGGSGENASGIVVIDSSGNGVFNVLSAGSGYAYGGFGIINTNICTDLQLFFNSESLASGTILPSSNFPPNQSGIVDIYPADATAETETLDIHWVTQAEFKHQQVNTHVECDGGILQTCSVKIQTQGYKTCEWCGEDTAFINPF